MKTLAAGLVGALVLVLPQAASAAGCASFQVSGSDLNLTYDPFGVAPIERIFTLRIQRQDPAASAVRFILVDPDASGGVTRIGQGPEGYGIVSVRDPSRPLLFRGAEQPNATNGLLTSFSQGAGGDIATETLRLSVPAGRAAPAGDFYEPIEVRFACETADGSVSTPDYQQGSQVAVDLRVPEKISTFIGAPGGRRGQISFGQLTAGGGMIQRDIVVTAQSTVPYSVELEAQRGRLQRRDEDDYGLDYQLRLSGLPIAPGGELVCQRTPAPAGRSHNLEVQLSQAQVGRVPAGSYSDTITMSFTPRLGLSGTDGCASGF